nr:flagellar hook-associated protein FlgL [uncultured Romboutsia sp.]
MRITNASMVRSHLYDTQNNLTNMSKINQQISTGKVINTVSDDPHKAIKIMNINNEIKYTEKYNYNIDESVGWMNTTDGALDNVGNLLGEIKETILKVGNGTYSQNEMKSLNEDMNEKIKQLADTLNSTHGGKYLFGGSSVDDAPITVIENPDGTVKLEFSKDKNGQTIPNTDDLKADISSGINIDYNISVGEILNIKDGNGNTVNLLDEINNLSTLMNDIANGDEQTAAKAKETLLNDTKGKIDTLFDHVVNERTSLGVRLSTAEKIKELNDEDILNIQDVLSKTQDTDVVEKFIELKSAEMIYQASIQVGAKLIQPTILDYIR